MGAVFLLVLWAYWPCTGHGFLHWDDDNNIVRNEAYRGLGPRRLLWMFTTTHMGPYQPLSWMTYGLDYLIWGMDPFGYHLTNVLLHAGGAMLMVWVAVTLFRAWQRTSGSAEAPREADDAPGIVDHAESPPTSDHDPGTAMVLLGGVLAALLWSLHPLRVESVAWVTERRDVVCGLFYLLCVGAYLRGHDPSCPRVRRDRWLFASRLSCLLAVLGKGTAVSLPLVLIALDVYPLRRLSAPIRQWWHRPHRGVLWEKGSYVVVSVFALGVGFWGQWHGGAIRSFGEVGPIDRVLIVGHAMLFYLSKTFLPVGLSPMYPRPDDIAMWSLRFGGSTLAVTALAAVLVCLRKRVPGVTTAAACYALMLLPASGLITIGHELVADRYSYLPAMAVALGMAGAAVWAWQRYRTGAARGALAVAGGVVVLILLVATRDLLPTWHDDIVLWERAVAVNPANARAQTNLGGAYALAGQYDKALDALRKAVQVDPKDTKAQHNLGVALRELRRYEQALAAFDRAIAQDPDYVLARHERAATLNDLERFDEALVEAAEVLRRQPEDPSLRYQLARAYLGKGEDDRAAELLAQVVEDGYRKPAVYADLAEALLRVQQAERAATVLLSASPAFRNHPEVRYALARVRTAQGRTSEALMLLGEALHAKPTLRIQARQDPMLDALRKEDRFRRLVDAVTRRGAP